MHEAGVLDDAAHSEARRLVAESESPAVSQSPASDGLARSGQASDRPSGGPAVGTKWPDGIGWLVATALILAVFWLANVRGGAAQVVDVTLSTCRTAPSSYPIGDKTLDLVVRGTIVNNSASAKDVFVNVYAYDSKTGAQVGWVQDMPRVRPGSQPFEGTHTRKDPLAAGATVNCEVDFSAYDSD